MKQAASSATSSSEHIAGSRPNQIYFDNHATTPVDPRVAKVVNRFMVEEFGNPSSTDHAYGDRANTAVEKAREQVAHLVGASSEEVYFVSGATEGINLVLQGLARGLKTRKLRVAVSAIEHRAVLDTCEGLSKLGIADLTWLRVDGRGRLDLEHLARVSDKVDVVCVMWANNEIGTINPMVEIAEIAAAGGAVVFSDATQAAGKIPISVSGTGVQFLTLSGHKMYGPKGVGAAIIPRQAVIEPLLFGGGQQRGLRPGTLNLPGIAGLGEASEILESDMEEDRVRTTDLRDQLEKELKRRIPDLVLNGDLESRLPGNLHLSIPNTPNSAIVGRVRDRLAVSTGSACSSGAVGPSHVLRAVGMAPALSMGAIRIGIGKFNTISEVDRASELLVESAMAVRSALGISVKT